MGDSREIITFFNDIKYIDVNLGTDISLTRYNYGNGEASERMKIPLYGSSVVPRCGSYIIDKSRDYIFLSRSGQSILLYKSKQTYIYLKHTPVSVPR